MKPIIKDQIVIEYEDREYGFANNIFSHRLFDLVTEALKAIEHKEGFLVTQNNHHLLSEEEKYVARVFTLYSKIDSTALQIRFVKLFTARNPLSKHYFKNGLNELAYIDYHQDMLFHKVHTMLELMRLMVNEIYGFEIPEKDCNWNSLKNKLADKDPVKLGLEMYFTAFESLINARHALSHRGPMDNPVRDEIEIFKGYRFYAFMANGQTFDEDFLKLIPMSRIKSEIRKYKKDKMNLINDVAKENGRLINIFFEHLLPVFESKLVKYKNG
ncbi:MAG: Cthe_2314 family HEPN domain-containing protein [Bacteroidota bacterium]